jgi:hypothetical protein
MSMINDEFEVCFELLLSVMLAKRRLWRVPVRVHASPTSRGPKKILKIKNDDDRYVY